MWFSLGLLCWLYGFLVVRPVSATIPCNPGPASKVRFRRARAYVRALPAGMILFPGTAALASITLFLAKNDLADGDAAKAYGYGTAIAVGVWLVSPLLLRRYAYADRSNPTVYAQLVEAYSALRVRAECISRAPDNACVLDEACRHLSYVGGELGFYDDGRQPPSGLRWVLATGYVDLWRRLHRAEEALILAKREELLIGDAVHDDLRLDGSKIASADQIRLKLRLAVSLLGEGATEFLNPPPPGLQKPELKPSVPAGSARGVLRAIRRTINDVRDDNREGLVRARNNLYATVLFAGLVAYLGLGLAMVDGVKREAIVAGAAFYLVGALVGLFRQLRLASATGTAGEDYGLSTARLIHTPLFSGIAGVAGPALVKVLPELTNQGTTSKDTLRTVFDLTVWPEGLIFAAVFGLAPTLLITSLQRRADQFQEELKSSDAGDKSTKD